MLKNCFHKLDYISYILIPKKYISTILKSLLNLKKNSITTIDWNGKLIKLFYFKLEISFDGKWRILFFNFNEWFFRSNKVLSNWIYIFIFPIQISFEQDIILWKLLRKAKVLKISDLESEGKKHKKINKQFQIFDFTWSHLCNYQYDCNQISLSYSLDICELKTKKVCLLLCLCVCKQHQTKWVTYAEHYSMMGLSLSLSRRKSIVEFLYLKESCLKYLWQHKCKCFLITLLITLICLRSLGYKSMVGF